MIIYNMRFRGPLEYEKFVLNSMQLHNEAYGPYAKEFRAASTSSILALAESVTKEYEMLVGKESTDPSKSLLGQSDKLYYLLLNRKG